MNYKKLIKDTLSPLGIPVEFQKYSGEETTYITFFCYNEQGEEWAENKEIATGYYIQVDIWSEDDITDLEELVKAAIITAGFKRKSAVDLNETREEDRVEVYHKAIRFSYVK